MDNNSVIYEELFTLLEANQNEEQAEKMSAYMKNQFPFLGIPKPQLKILIRPYLKKIKSSKSIDWNFIHLCWEKDYREAQYTALEYLQSVEKKLTINDIPELQKLIVTKAWWENADTIDEMLGIISLSEPQVHSIMLDWSKSDNIWIRRVAIDYQQKLKEQTNQDVLAQIIINNLDSNEFFINKAIGWSLREYRRINADWVEGFLKQYDSHLSNLSKKEALK